MTNNETVTYRLSQEELLLILMRFHLPLIVGMNMALTELTAEQLELLLGAGERSLLAREYLMIDERGEAQIDPTVIALAAACSQPDRSIVMARSAANQKDATMTINFARQMVVVHVPIDPGVHQFTALPGAQYVPGLVEAYMNLPAAEVEAGMGGQVSEEAYTSARELISSNQSNQAAALLEQLLPAGTAKALVLALGASSADTTFAAIATPHDNPQSLGGFSVLESPGQAWLIVPQRAGEVRQLAVRPASAEALRQEIARLASI